MEMPKLDPEIKAKWLEALRSDRYPKTKGALYRMVPDRTHGIGLCCLGVVCMVKGVEFKVEAGSSAFIFPAENGFEDAHSAFLPEKWFNFLFEGEPPQEVTNFIMHELSSLNDRVETFQPVIDYIERNL